MLLVVNLLLPAATVPAALRAAAAQAAGI